jgi:NAD(P)H-dependent flavin oxidoreductase YrpB (nitropropane dioxygenase family)
VSELLERLGVELPIVQAGMGGGLAGHELAAAVSGAGGLGTIGILEPDALRAEIGKARERLGGPAAGGRGAATASARGQGARTAPIAVNLLLPFARRGHWEAAAAADVVVTFWGRPRRRTERVWIHQCGSVDEALAAQAAGADGVIAQGVEAGGHVRGTTPALVLLERTRAAFGADYPILLAGGIADARDVRTALDAGADAAVLGTRFLMTDESRALTAYKQRLMESRETVLTELFGAGWPRAPHRVIWNEAAERWLDPADPRGPRSVRALHVAVSPLLRRVPMSRQGALARQQRPDRPLLGPLAAAKGGPPNLLDSGPLYAGESVARIHDLRPAGELVGDLASANAPRSPNKRPTS